MRALSVLLFLAVLSAAAAPHARAVPSPAACSAETTPQTPARWVSAATVVEPADADGSGGTLVFASRASGAYPAAFALSAIEAVRPSAPRPHASRPHLLERAAHPSTAPPLPHA